MMDREPKPTDETEEITVKEYDLDGTLVRTAIERVARRSDPADARTTALEEKVHQMAMLADTITPDAVTTVAGAKAQIAAIKTALQAGKRV
jgi:hypothetical protein